VLALTFPNRDIVIVLNVHRPDGRRWLPGDVSSCGVRPVGRVVLDDAVSAEQVMEPHTFAVGALPPAVAEELLARVVPTRS
jgi:hypothetical protein